METSTIPQPEVQQQLTTPEENTQQQDTAAKADKAETKVAEQDIAETSEVKFPVIYFDFNSIAINPDEESKLNEILHILKENPDMKVTVTGWCDTRGSVAVNRRISRQRAETLKAWLVKKGIAASRISATGKGSDGSREAPKARRVETKDNHQ